MSRKFTYSMNVQVVGGPDYLIYDCVLGWGGSNHDTRVFDHSEFKLWLEGQHEFLVAGDGGYTLSRHLMIPYTTAESGADPDKALFNTKLSALRTILTECIFGILKRRWALLQHLPYNMEMSQKFILCAMILHIMSVLWGQLEEEDLNIQLPQPAAPGNEEVHGEIENDHVRRERAQAKRNEVRADMRQ